MINHIKELKTKTKKMMKDNKEILNDLRIWLQKYVIAWGVEGPDMKIIMLKELDKVFTKKIKND